MQPQGDTPWERLRDEGRGQLRSHAQDAEVIPYFAELGVELRGGWQARARGSQLFNSKINRNRLAGQDGAPRHVNTQALHSDIRTIPPVLTYLL